MKKLILVFLFVSTLADAQQTTYSLLKVGDHATILPSAILEVKSTTAGFLLPRMTTTQKNAIVSPATGLLVYDTTLNAMASWNGSSWQTLQSLSSIGTIDTEASPSANALTLTNGILYAQSASATAPGMVNNNSQTFSGTKTFSSNPTFSSMSSSGVVTNNSSGALSSTTLGTTTESTSDVLTLGSWSNATLGSPTIQVKKATSTQDGYLGSTDWSTFNGKQSALSGTVTESTSDVLTLGSWANATNGSPTIQVKKATTSQDGYLGSADWSTFNGKQSAVTFGTVTESTSDVLTLSSWSNATQGSPTIQVKKATTTQDGYLASTDWATFNGKQSTISVTAPIGLSGAVISANVPWAITASTSTTTGEIIKGASGQSNDLVDWENSTGTVLSEVNSAGKVGVGTTSPNAMVQVNAASSTTVGEIVQGASSQSSDLVDWENSTGTILSEITSIGDIGIGTTAPAANTMVQINTASTTTTGLIVKGIASQANDLQDWNNSTGTVLAKISSAGALTLPSALATSSGGTGTASAGTQWGVVYYSTTTGMASTAAGSSGNVLTSNGTSAPTFQASGSSVTNDYYSGFHANGDSWSTTSATLADPTPGASPVLTQRFSNGITVVTNSSELPGITFTPAASTSIYLVSATFTTDFSSNLDCSYSLTDGTHVIAQRDVQGITTVTNQTSITLTGPYAPGTGSSVTVKLQIAASSGTCGIASAGTIVPAIEWSVVQIK